MLANPLRVWIFILTASFTFLLVGYSVGGRFGLVLGFFVAFIFNIFIFYFGETHLTEHFDMKLLAGQDPWLVHHHLKKLCNQLNIPVPDVYLVPSRVPTAFCLGFKPFSSAICVTTGLLETFSVEDLEAVLAYQVCQIQSLDSFLFGVMSVLANALVGIGESLDRCLLLPVLRRRHLFASIFSVGAWFCLKFTIRQNSFFAIDIKAAKLLNERRRLAEVLWRLNGVSLSCPLSIPPCTQHLFILNPEGSLAKNSLLKFHPSIDLRIRNLIGYYPI